jgi:hypothetical protein
MEISVWIALGLGLLVGGLVIVVRLAASLGGRESFTRQIAFRCPFSRRDVRCTLVQDTRTGKWVEVRNCSAFADPGRVLCGAPCLRMLNTNRGRSRAARPSRR